VEVFADSTEATLHWAKGDAALIVHYYHRSGGEPETEPGGEKVRGLGDGGREA
jgi:hypothetical protein